MKTCEEILISPNASVRTTIQTIDTSALQIALIVDESRKLLGVVTDGDIRRGILKGVGLDEPVHLIMNRNPTVTRPKEDRAQILRIMKLKRFLQIPVVDDQGRVLGMEILNELIQDPLSDNVVVLMAGGMGHRLRPLTFDCPKPLLKVGNKPILETILESFIGHGFRRFYLSVNYKAEMVMDYFGNGSRWGIDVEYIVEKQKLGTAGPLALLPEKPSLPLLVMNGDLLTNINFNQLLDFHQRNAAKATMCVREYDFQVPYGVVKINNHRITSIEEKPVHNFFVSAGIYVLEPEVLDLIPANAYFDMPALFHRLLEQDQIITPFPIREYWLDIGKVDDFERANGEYAKVFE